MRFTLFRSCCALQCCSAAAVSQHVQLSFAALSSDVAAQRSCADGEGPTGGTNMPPAGSQRDEPGGSACCYWNRCGSGVTTRFKEKMCERMPTTRGSRGGGAAREQTRQQDTRQRREAERQREKHSRRIAGSEDLGACMERKSRKYSPRQDRIPVPSEVAAPSFGEPAVALVA